MYAHACAKANEGRQNNSSPARKNVPVVSIGILVARILPQLEGAAASVNSVVISVDRLYDAVMRGDDFDEPESSRAIHEGGARALLIDKKLRLASAQGLSPQAADVRARECR